MIDPGVAIKILKALGYTNLLFLLLTFFSCRCLAGRKLTKWLVQYDWYRKFYKWHCWFWWGFYVSVIIHSLIAWYLFGFGFS